MFNILQSNPLPRLLYVGDVPVESSYHGSALLYRLLEDYPSDRLLILESAPFLSIPTRRLPGVRYRVTSMPGSRLQHTRFHRAARAWLTFSSPASFRRIQQSINGFVPDAMLTVAHGYSWLAAARLAKRDNIPLHLILHDDWLTMTSSYSRLSQWQSRLFQQNYNQAVSRLCVSPFMEREYAGRYGVEGKVLFPSRSKQYCSIRQLPLTYHKRAGPLVGAYAGSIFNSGYARLIVGLAECLERRGGKLLLYGELSSRALALWGLNRRNVFPQGLVSSVELVRRLGEEADFTFVPMSFETDGREDHMRLAFPSKLTDYTATGVPLLICGPPYCSAVRWAQHYANVAEVVTSESSNEMENAVNRLEDANHRERLGKFAKQVGDRLFSYEAAMEMFLGALRTDLPQQA